MAGEGEYADFFFDARTQFEILGVNDPVNACAKIVQGNWWEYKNQEFSRARFLLVTGDITETVFVEHCVLVAHDPPKKPPKDTDRIPYLHFARLGIPNGVFQQFRAQVQEAFRFVTWGPYQPSDTHVWVNCSIPQAVRETGGLTLSLGVRASVDSDSGSEVKATELFQGDQENVEVEAVLAIGLRRDPLKPLTVHPYFTLFQAVLVKESRVKAPTTWSTTPSMQQNEFKQPQPRETASSGSSITTKVVFRRQPATPQSQGSTSNGIFYYPKSTHQSPNPKEDEFCFP